MKPWEILSRRVVYDSDWIRMQLLDIRLPDGTVLHDMHLVDYPRPAAGIIPVRADGQILLVEHYRFQTDTHGWEIPAGRVEAGEEPINAARRELREETGHAAREFVPLGRYHPSNGSTNQTFYMFTASGVERTGEIEDTNEIGSIRWFTVEQVRGMIARNKILDGMSLTGLLWYLFTINGDATNADGEASE